MKETTELFGLVAKGVDATYKSTADGKFDFPADIANFFNAFLAAPEAIKDVNKIGTEAISATAADKDRAFDQIRADMPNVPVEDRSDISDFLKGMYSIYRLAKRAGYEEGKAAALAELRAAGKIK